MDSIKIKNIISKKCANILVCIFINIILSGCDLFFNHNSNNSKNNSRHQVNTNISNSSIISQDQSTQAPRVGDSDIKIQNRKGMVFFQYEGQEGKKQQKLINDLKNRISPLDVTIVRKSMPINLNLYGHYSYVLFTGSHGEFENGAPVKFNGIKANRLQKALEDSNFSADVLIFDTCFGSGFIPNFIKGRTVNPGGKIICAHGECQGYAQAIRDSNDGSSLYDVFDRLLQALDDLGAKYNSLSLYTHNISQPNSNEKYGTFYIRNYANRRNAIETARFLGITDTEDEIEDLEQYLSTKRIDIVRVNKEPLKKIFKNHLKNIII